MESQPPILTDVTEALDEYLKLKLKYQEQQNKNKKKITSNTTLSKREKRMEYLKLKPKCINCGNPGGTTFKNSYFPDTDKEEAHRQYSATCGVLVNPCVLNIKIKVGNVEMLPDLLNTIQDEIKDTKNKIIEYKNKLLFGYLTAENVLVKFDELKETISNYTSLYESYLDHYNKVVDNDETKANINKHITESYILIEKIKECIIKMNEQKNDKFAKDAVEIYIEQLVPTLDTISDLKFVENVVWYDDDFKSYHLIQKKYNTQSLSYNSFNNVVSAFDVGRVIPPTSVKGDAVVKDSVVNLSIEKPSRVIPSATARLAISTEDILPEIPTYSENNASWKNPAYIKIWDRMPLKFKTLLLTDHKWLEYFMFNCVKNIANSKPCDFSAPVSLKVPPIQLANGSQDFGVKIYNELYEKLPASTKETYLTLYNEKDGVKNYGMLINAMNNLVKKEVDFDRGYF